MQGLTADTISSLVESAYSEKGPKTWWITRLAMYKALNNALAPYDRPGASCLAISHSEGFGRDVLGLQQTAFTQADYPKYNLLNLSFDSEHFDFCISDQVLEHIEGNPYKAFAETARVIKSGGHVCHTTCFINGIHAAPNDFWRYTPQALKLLATDAGLETEVVGGWGNREAQAIINSRFRMSKIPDNPNNPIYKLALKNEPDYPVVTWIIARKP